MAQSVAVKEAVTPDTKAYESSFMSDFYDGFWEGGKAPFDDSPVIFEAVKSAYKLRQPPPSPSDRFVVFDIGTGTGRVLRNLVRDAAKENFDMQNVELVGIDLAKPMLDRAKKLAKMDHVGKVSWVLGNGLDMQAIPEIKDLKVDFLAFAVGSIGHLLGERDPETFLHEVSKVVRPETGRAYIPLLSMQIAERHEAGNMKPLWEGDMSMINLPDPSISIRDVDCNHYVKDAKYVTEAKMTIYKTDEKGDEHAVDTLGYVVELRIWKDEEYLGAAKTAGLKHLKTVSWPEIAHYFFMVEK
ncbi:hypothetical protein FQN49_001279 [Arthroderma sp. PD_2]|nr:hypothetical protein FQN49_001279 [Arthroderma sp. PD_2]